MMRIKFYVILAVLTFPGSLFAQTIQQDLQTARDQFKTATLTPAQVLLMLDSVAWKHRTEGWGLLLKPNGNGINFLGKQIAGDILFNSANAHHYDVLIDWEAAATVTWDDKGVMDLNRFQAPIDPSALGGVVTEPDNSNPGNAVDLSRVYSELLKLQQQNNGTQGQNERIFENSTRQREEIQSLILALSEQLKTHDERVGRIEKIFKSWQTYIITAAPFLGYYLNKLTGNEQQNVVN